MSVESNRLAIAEAAGQDLCDMIVFDLPAVLHSRDSGRRKIIKIMSMADRASKLIAPHTPCKRGCSHCCHMATTISFYEAENIALATGRAMAHVTPDLDRRRQIQKYRNVPCTFLKDGECSIYDARPIACRVHHSIEDTADPCDIKNGVRDVASLNMLALQTSIAFLLPTCADIREFFPTID